MYKTKEDIAKEGDMSGIEESEVCGAVLVGLRTTLAMFHVSRNFPISRNVSQMGKTVVKTILIMMNL